MTTHIHIFYSLYTIKEIIKRAYNFIVYLGCDGFGESLQVAIEEHLKTLDDIQIINLGCDTYFDAAAKVSRALQKDTSPESFGILFCGTGMGVNIIANKFDGIRAAVVENKMAAKCARAINDSNVICFGKLVTPPDQAVEILQAYMAQDFIEQPTDNDGKAVNWWSEDIVKFLQSSKEGILQWSNLRKNEGVSLMMVFGCC